MLITCEVTLNTNTSIIVHMLTDAQIIVPSTGGSCLASPQLNSSLPPQGRPLLIKIRRIPSNATKYSADNRPISSNTNTSVRFSNSLLDASRSSFRRQSLTMSCEKDSRLFVTVSGKTRCRWLPPTLRALSLVHDIISTRRFLQRQ